jgi:hypothetical protein
MKRKYSDDPSLWADEAIQYYQQHHGIGDTHKFINKKYFVSWVAIKKFFKENDLMLNRSQAQSNKRYNCFCRLCKQDFLGKAPNTTLCYKCIGDNIPGKTNVRVNKLAFFQRLKLYGIDIEIYNKMFELQNGLCKLCNEKLTMPCIDHNHETGKVRGLLCNRCNLLLGKLELLQKTNNLLTNILNYINYDLNT